MAAGGEENHEAHDTDQAISEAHLFALHIECTATHKWSPGWLLQHLLHPQRAPAPTYGHLTSTPAPGTQRPLQAFSGSYTALPPSHNTDTQLKIKQTLEKNK